MRTCARARCRCLAELGPRDSIHLAIGQLSGADLLATVPGQDAVSGSESACVAHYYIGAKHLIAGERVEAISHFKTCIASGRRDINEIRSAEAELVRLAQPQK